MSIQKLQRARVTPLLAGCLLSLVLPVCGVVSGADSGRCISAWVPEALILPDGSIEPAGSRLSVCLTREFTPVSGLHRTMVNGQVIGMFSSRIQTGAAASSAVAGPYFEFRRTPGRELALSRYTALDGTDSETYVFAIDPSVTSHWEVSHNQEEAEQDVDDVALLSANGL